MAGYAPAALRLPVMGLDTGDEISFPQNGITSTSGATGCELDGAGLAVSGRLRNSIKIREVSR